MLRTLWLETIHERAHVNDSFSSAQNQIQPYFMQQHTRVVNGDGAYAPFNAAQNPTAFSTGASNAQYAVLMVNWAKSHGDNDIGILSDGTSFSVELAADAEADVKAAGLNLNWTATPAVHNGYPSASLKECTMKQGPYDILSAAS